MVAVAVVWFIAKAFKGQGAALPRPLLGIQFLLRTCAVILSAMQGHAASRSEAARAARANNRWIHGRPGRSRNPLHPGPAFAPADRAARSPPMGANNR